MSQPFKPIIPADIKWQNGIPYANQFDDIYFSRENGLAESYYVYLLGNDLIPRWKRLSNGKSFVIVETGFGTGLNFLLTMKLWQQIAPKNSFLTYYACEKHPLKISDLEKALSLWPELEEYAKQLVKLYPTLTPGFHSLEFSSEIFLNLIFEDAEASLLKLLPSCGKKVDSWYLDGFAPAKNKSMWTIKLFKLIGKLSHQTTQLSTFSCARQIKDGLRGAGFTFEKIKGYGKKREMIKAKMSSMSPKKIFMKEQYFWQYGHYHAIESNEAIVIGAGLAGCMIAYHLAELGWKIKVYDKASNPGNGASANPRAVLFPSFSAYESPLSQLMLQAYPHALRFYKKLNLTNVEHDLRGMITLEEGSNIGPITRQWLTQLSPMVSFLSKRDLSDKVGLELYQNGLWFPESGWINSQQLCMKLIDHENIQFFGNLKINNVERDKQKWCVNDFSSEVVIFANGWLMKNLCQSQYLPLRAIKGQMTIVKSTAQSDLLQVPLCCNGHVLPASNGCHYVGATYEIDCPVAESSDKNDIENLKNLRNMPVSCKWSNQVVDNWTGIRTTTNDYMPVVGAMPNQKQFMENFNGLNKDANLLIENKDPFEPNLYAISGFGSKGLTTIPLCASYLSKMINNQTANISNTLISTLAPARFLRRSIIRRKNEL